MSKDSKGGSVHRLASPHSHTFIVSRTSDCSGTEKPCEGAYRVEVLNVDRRVEGFDPTDSADWFQRGTNHRIENGCHCRDMDWREEWAIDIYDVMEFVAEHGDCVVSRNREGFNEIEIYDDYRE